MNEPVWSIWELLQTLRGRAEASGLEVIDLGQGTPTDPTPTVIQTALAAAGESPGYPPAHGTPQLCRAYCDWAQRRWGATIVENDVIATVGSKELIATLPWMLGLGARDLVVIPELAYPTYAAGAAFAGCEVLAADSLLALGPANPALVWINTPANPTGKVLPTAHLRKVVDWTRERDALLVSDECYIELTHPGETAPSVLSPEVCGGVMDNILVVHSLSKRSSMAGYRAGFVAGDSAVIARLLKRRRDTGLIVPGPIQAAAVAALNDDAHVTSAQHTYERRRTLLTHGLAAAGFRVDESGAGLFVWATIGESDQATAQQFADLGVLVAPGGFYGPSGRKHVRLSLTVPDEALEEVIRRLQP